MDTILVCSNVSRDAIDDDALAAEQLRTLAERADERGLMIAYEALAWGRHVSEYDHAWRIVETADHPALGTCLDSFHILSRGTDLAAIDTIPGEKIFFLQLADAPYLTMDVLQWSRHYRCFPGQGALDVAALVDRVLAAGYAGPLSLEVFNDVFRQADPARTAIDAMRSLIVLEDRLPRARAARRVRVRGDRRRRELGPRHRGAPARDGLRPRRPAPQQAGAAVGARRDPGRAQPRRRRRGPGGRGDRRLQPRSRGHATRAEALLAPRVERRRGAGEADLTAVAAPDGTAVFVCGTDWLGDFLPTGESGGEGVPIQHIDHITLAQPFEAFDEAGLFYRSVLDLQPSESQELAAPDGLVRSRAFASGDGRVRVVLNVPALAGGRQGELQHVAFACGDALATARAMRERGVPLVHVPGNYYDDLAVRLELEPALLEELRELDVLYDRTADGELLHFYTAHIGGRVFFEVLERRGGYSGYGAANSPIRMAAIHLAEERDATAGRA